MTAWEDSARREARRCRNRPGARSPQQGVARAVDILPRLPAADGHGLVDDVGSASGTTASAP